MAASIELLGVRVDDVTQDEATERIVALVGTGRHHVVTVNPEFVMQAQGDPEFRAVLNRASLALPDGVGLVWGARLVRRRLRGRATGVETVLGLAQASQRPGGPSLFLLGAGTGVAAAAATELERRYPGCRIVGTWSGSPDDAAFAAIRERVDAARPDILLVAYGAPRQDLWIARWLAELDCSVAMGVGGTFDYLSGRVRRAPGWMRRAGFEWLYRLIRQPWRARRMLRLPRFAWRLLAERRKG